MNRIKWIAGLFFISVNSHAQELFVFTEPASNMPAKSFGVRTGNWLMRELNDKVNYHLIPELMLGINKKLMLHAEGFLSNRNQSFSLEGGAIYAKYRFISQDDVFRHFRMAGFARGSINNAPIHQEEIETNGHNTGYEAGLIATQLFHKLALSVSMSYEKALNNISNNELPDTYEDNVMNYSFSAGRLMLPKEYTSYKQTNVNVMLEILGQTQLQTGQLFIDLAPSLQFIINSQFRIDLAYKQQVYNTMLRSAPNGVLIRLEYLLFNVF
jgi:hypothetical protein